jgi:hypothetical protein
LARPPKTRPTSRSIGFVPAIDLCDAAKFAQASWRKIVSRLHTAGIKLKRL